VKYNHEFPNQVLSQAKIIDIGACQAKEQNIAAVIHRKMQLEAIKPTH
jgi:hypothetical protein